MPATQSSLPKLAPLAARIPRHQSRDHHRLWPHGHSWLTSYDAGVRSGEQVAKDMIAVRIGPAWTRMAARRCRLRVSLGVSIKRKKPRDKLIGHNCITLLLPHGGLYAWEFEKGGRELRVRVEGQLTFTNTTAQMLNAALAGLGLGVCPKVWCSLTSQEVVSSGYLKNGACPIQAITSGSKPPTSSAAFALLVDALRHRQ